MTRAVVLQSPERAGRRASPVITLVQHAVTGQVSRPPPACRFSLYPPALAPADSPASGQAFSAAGFLWSRHWLLFLDMARAFSGSSTGCFFWLRRGLYLPWQCSSLALPPLLSGLRRCRFSGLCCWFAVTLAGAASLVLAHAAGLWFRHWLSLCPNVSFRPSRSSLSSPESLLRILSQLGMVRPRSELLP